MGIGKDIGSRSAIVFFARQHPSEAMGSFIVEKTMKYLNENN